jgi:hypothetical protein
MICSAIRRTEWIAVALAGLLLPGAVFAELPAAESPRARALFFEARRLMGERRWAEACPLLEESERLDPGKGTEFNLADCYEHTGRPASALALFERVVEESRRAGLPAHEARARSRAEAVAPRVPRLVVELADGARVDGLSLSCDGRALSAPLVSTVLPLDPGEHRIAARAPGRVAWETTIHLAEGASETVRVPPLAAIAPEAPPPVARSVIAPAPAPTPSPVAPAPAPARSPGAPATPAPRRASPRRTVGIALTTTGAAAIIAGGVFGVLSLVARNDARASCSDVTNLCGTPDGVDARAAAILRGNLATGLIAGGAALLTAGLVVWLAPDHRRRVALDLRATGVGALAGVGGDF